MNSPDTIYYFTHYKGTRWNYKKHEGQVRPELYHVMKRKEPGRKAIYMNKPVDERTTNRPDQALFKQGRNISGLFETDTTRPGFGYGDIRGTEDAILTVRDSEAGTLKIMVFEGLKKQKEVLFQNWATGGISEAISYNKLNLSTESVTEK